MCKYCQNPVLDRDDGYWLEYKNIPNSEDKAADGLRITTSGPYIRLESLLYPVGIEINYCPICGRKLRDE